MTKNCSSNDIFMRDLSRQERVLRLEQVASGVLISAEDFAARRGLSSHAVSKMAETGKIFSLETNAGRQYYPAFYADFSLQLRDLERVSEILAALPGSSRWQFFTTPKISLEARTPLQALKDGDIRAVMLSAQGFVER